MYFKNLSTQNARVLRFTFRSHKTLYLFIIMWYFIYNKKQKT